MPEWLQMILRSIALIFILFALIKLLGKKRSNQLSIFDYITAFVVSSMGAVIVLDNTLPFLQSLLALSIWLIIPFIVDFISLKSKRFRNFIQGKSTVIIKEGKILEDNLKKERLSTDDLLYHLRENNVFKAADVEFALIEPTGKMTVMPKSEQQPLTRSDLNINTAPQSEIHTVIMDGEILLEPLAEQGKNPAWLKDELEKLNVTKENVFLAQLDDDAQLTIDLYDDNIQTPSPSEKPLLLATMKKAQADLELFSLETDNEQSKALYEKNQAKLKEIIEKLSPYLQG